ncbi:MAG: outer membrane protein assembly factor BamA, partial [Calditerrivibrio sp.]|nr:outer membrane protein assembly factor BamA [Calditerrivibrio sp.]
MKKLLLLFLFIGLANYLFASTLDDVIIQGNKRVSSSKIYTFIPKKGEEFDLKKVDDSVKKLYESGLFLDIKVDLKFDQDRMILTYIVKEKPFINKIYFEGN